LTINKADEELVRNAAKLIEKKMKNYATDYAFKDHQDLLAMVALQFATSALNYEEDSDFKDHQLRHRLVEIDRLISETLNE
jgi:hypothetical protein